MTIATNLSFPRMGKNRQLKRGFESCWDGSSGMPSLLGTASNLREHWRLEHTKGLELVPSNDDQVLDTIELVGVVPPRYTSLEDSPIRDPKQTGGWAEVEPALRTMVQAVRRARAGVA